MFCSGVRRFLCGALAAFCLGASPAPAQTESRPATALTLKGLYTFPGGAGALDPWGGLTVSNGVFYGTTANGGAHNRGALYAVTPTSGAETLLYSFAQGDATGPQSGVAAVDGVLYGIGNAGGAHGFGGLYSYTIATHAEKLLFSFPAAMGGGSGSTVTISGSTLYGTTFGTGTGYGTVFKFDLTTGLEKTLYKFTGGADGGNPHYGVTLANGILYGATSVGGSASAGVGAGTLFAVNAATGAETTLFAFDGTAHGGNPYGGVIDVGGVLYGTTVNGGGLNAGAVFAYDLSTGTETTLYNFTGREDGANPQSALIDVGGILYGTSSAGDGGLSPFGAVFAVNAKTGAETTLYTFPPDGSNGGHPLSPLLYYKDALYGTSFGLETAIDQCGTVFKIDIATHAETTLHNFVGASPYGQGHSGLADIGGTFYGVTGTGGADFYGTIYKVDAATGVLSTLHVFTGGADGGAPQGGLVSDGTTLYGVAQVGGANQAGVVFAFNPASRTQSVLYSFKAGAGTPTGPLALSGGVLYGTASFGGSDSQGSVFAYTLKTNSFATLYSFTGGLNGSNPLGGVTVSGGSLYGAAEYGGDSSGGVIFKVDITTGAETALHEFGYDSNGTFPNAPPVVVNGVLYGTTLYGGTASTVCFGTFGCGVLYSINLASNAFTVLHSFDYVVDGALPSQDLLYTGGRLYASTQLGAAPGFGTLWSYDPAKSSFATLYRFTGGADGGNPDDTLLVANGVFYGTTNTGTANGSGTIFSFVP
jgi:uncharacterized repeat protein (TIGR03803 family)